MSTFFESTRHLTRLRRLRSLAAGVFVRLRPAAERSEQALASHEPDWVAAELRVLAKAAGEAVADAEDAAAILDRLIDGAGDTGEVGICFSIESDAFQPEPRIEVARLLRELADDIEGVGGMKDEMIVAGAEWTIRDRDGREVGRMCVGSLGRAA